MGVNVPIKSLANKTALITGASRGLGACLAKRFHQEGATLILVARSREKLAELRSQLMGETTSPPGIELAEVDLANAEAVNHFIQERVHHRPIDILINNAASQGPIGACWENDWQAWQRTMQINLLTPVALCRAVIPEMLKRHEGNIINLSGGGATNARPNFSAYAVSKTGLVRFSETLAEEVKSFNIAVNCLAPGIMNTDMLTEMLAAGEEKVGQSEFNQIKQKLNTAGSTMERAAELCHFLAASNQHRLTGKLISAVWDPWKNLPHYMDELMNSDIYTLRRIVPDDRGKTWETLS
jgi:NAD(P)-dependent dehydrogenase (short-subunit alcohol dehydrogenase family)